MAGNDPHTGSRFDDFLEEEGVFDEVQAKALERALAQQLARNAWMRSLKQRVTAAWASSSA
jgi:hypothetical protein